jgi:hypothetical protein
MSLGEDDEVKHVVEASVAASIQAMADQASRRSLDRSYASVGGKLGIRGQ